MDPIADVRGISKIAYGFIASRALFAALDLDLFSRLSGQPKTLAALSEETRVPETLLLPFLTTLVSVGLLVKDEARYSNAPASESYLVRGATRDFGDYLRLVVGKVNYSYASELEKALRGDRKPSAAGYYTSWYSSPEDAEQFTSAQHRGSLGPAAVLARQIELGGRRQLLDVGGGSGAFTIALCRRNPDLTATILDFPETVAVARRFVTEAGLQGRVRHLAGNALHVDWPGAQDAILMSYVWSAVGRSDVEELARRAYTALRSGGTVLIHDFMADDDLRGPSNAAFHLLLSALDTQEMALLTPSLVRERLARVGFTGTTASTLLPGITSLVIGHKA